MYKKQGWRGEVGDGGKRGTEQERGVGGLGRWSEIFFCPPKRRKELLPSTPLRPHLHYLPLFLHGSSTP